MTKNELITIISFLTQTLDGDSDFSDSISAISSLSLNNQLKRKKKRSERWRTNSRRASANALIIMKVRINIHINTFLYTSMYKRCSGEHEQIGVMHYFNCIQVIQQLTKQDCPGLQTLSMAVNEINIPLLASVQWDKARSLILTLWIKI